MPGQTINKVLAPVFKELTDRQKAVLVGRFGLEGSDPLTLEALGKRYGVTRERIRQIEASALSLVKAKLATSPTFQSLVNHGKKYLKSVGGVATENAFVSGLVSFSKDATPNNVALLTSVSDDIQFYGEDEHYTSFYYLDKESYKTATQFVNQWVNTLRTDKDAVLAGAYDSAFRAFVKSKSVSSGEAQAYLAISKKIGENPYGDKGLNEWEEITPKTIRDRIYLVLKKKAQPLHFESIAKEINAVGFSGRLALASTCHNELIKDTRFVLVGRGLYGLEEHGYQPGTAKEVIHRILKSKGPMKAKDLVNAVQKERFFKNNTILVNLQNRDLFDRSNDGAYKVREA